MRKVALGLCGLILAAQFVYGDIRVFGGFGLDNYNASIFGQDNWEQKVGQQYGVGVDFDLIQNVALSVEGIYRQTGAKMVHWVSGYRVYTVDYTLKEIFIPLLLKATFGEGIEHHFLFGGALSYILSHDAEIVEDVEIAIFFPETKKFYTSMIFGLGIGGDIGIVSIYVEGRYITALENILTWEETFQKPRGITFLFGIAF
jgi:hypothetical protein